MESRSNLGMKMGINKSNELWEKANRIIATGTQTFSRSPGVYPDGAAPKYLFREQGSHVWDVDGNEYIDMVMGCGPITLGHNFKPINDAIKKQLEDGILFSMLHPLEIDVAEKLVDFMLDKTFQEDIPLQMFVFPANQSASLPDLFTQYAQIPDDPTMVPPDAIETNRETWIEAWTETVLQK